MSGRHKKFVVFYRCRFTRVQTRTFLLFGALNQCSTFVNFLLCFVFFFFFFSLFVPSIALAVTRKKNSWRSTSFDTNSARNCVVFRQSTRFSHKLHKKLGVSNKFIQFQLIFNENCVNFSLSFEKQNFCFQCTSCHFDVFRFQRVSADGGSRASARFGATFEKRALLQGQIIETRGAFRQFRSEIVLKQSQKCRELPDF